MSSVPIEILSVALSDGLTELFYAVLKLLDSQQGNQIRGAHGNDTQADECGQGGGRNVRIPQTQDAQDNAADAQQRSRADS